MLERTALAEITQAYDFLHELLKTREQQLKRRLHEAIKTYGRERVVQERRDWSKESESMPDLLRRIYMGGEVAIEDYLSVQAQIDSMSA